MGEGFFLSDKSLTNSEGGGVYSQFKLISHNVYIHDIKHDFLFGKHVDEKTHHLLELVPAF